MPTWNSGLEYAIANNKIYRLNPTNFAETSKGAYGVGGTVEELEAYDPSTLYSKYGLRATDIKFVSPEDIAQYQSQANPSDAQIKANIYSAFEAQDPGGLKTGNWNQNYVIPNLDSLIAKAKEYGAGDLATYGKIFNEYRYQPTVDKTYQDYRTAEAKQAEEAQRALNNSTNPTVQQPTVNNTMTKEKWDEAVRNDPGFAQLFAQYNPYGSSDQSGLGSKIPDVSTLKELSKLGLTENDIIRQGGSIYLKPGSQYESKLGNTATQLGSKIPNVTTLQALNKLGLTESDIIRSGSDIYLKPGSKYESSLNQTSSGLPETYDNLPAEDITEGSDVTIPYKDPNATISDSTSLYDSVDAALKAIGYSEGLTGETAGEKTQSKLLQTLMDEMAAMKNKESDLLTEQEKLKVAEQTAALGDLDIQIAQAKAAAQSSIQALSNQAIPTPFIVGQQNEQIKTYNIVLGNLATVRLAMQGKLDAAKSLAEETNNLKYASKERDIDYQLQLLSINQSIMDQSDKKKAAALQIILDQKKQEIADAKETSNNISNLAIQMIQNGAPTSVYNEVMKQTTIAGALNVGGQYLSSNNEKALVLDMAGKYVDAGILPTDSLSIASSKLKNSRIYQDQVRGPVGSGGGGSSGPLGLTNTQIDNISPLVSQFQSSAIVSNYNTIGEGYNFANSISTQTTNPADDQALIYALAKALDPGSVVREGEYATVQKYAQSMAQAYGKSVNQAINGSGFLSEDARRNIKNTINTRFKAAETSYNNLYKETERRINLIGNTDKGSQLLNNYGGAFAPTNTQNQQVNTQNIVSEPAKKPGFWSSVGNWLFGND